MSTRTNCINQSTLDLNKYRQACERGVQWCLNLQNPDGSIIMPERCFDSFYKFPAAFAVMGKYVEAGKTLNWLENETLTVEGDFRFPDRKHIFNWFESFYTYTNSWIILAAQRNGFFRLADKGVHYLLKYQNKETGVLQSGPIETDKTGYCDTAITSQGGICFLYTGHSQEALKAADALCHIANSQDEPSCFYFRTDREGNLLKEPPEDIIEWIRVDQSKEGQLYYYLGIAAAFLCHAYEFSGREQYLENAKRYADFAISSKGSLSSFAAGKCGYCYSLLYRSTGEKKYWNAAIEYLRWLMRVQKPDGQWILDEWAGEHEHWYFNYDCTAEFTYWVSEMAKHLSSPRKHLLGKHHLRSMLV